MEPVENESSDHKEVISSSILRKKIAPLENAVLRMEKIMADTQSRIRKLIISSPESSTLSQDISSSSSQINNSKSELEVAHAEKDNDPDNDTEVIDQFFSDEKSTTLPEIQNGILTPCDSSTSADETYLLNNVEASSTCNYESNHKKENKVLTMPRITAQVVGRLTLEATEVSSSTTEEFVVTSSSNFEIHSQSNGDAMNATEQISFSDEDTIILESDDERGISDETESGSSDNIAIKLYDVDDESLSYNDVGETKDSSNRLNEPKKCPNECGKVSEAISCDHTGSTCNHSSIELDTHTNDRRSPDGERNDCADMELIECNTEALMYKNHSSTQNMYETNKENLYSGKVVIDGSEYNDRINRTLLSEINNVPYIPENQKVINKDEMIDDKIVGEVSFKIEVAPKNTVPNRFTTDLVETSVVPQETIEYKDENETDSSGKNNCTEEAEIVEYFEKDTCCVYCGDDQESEEYLEAEEGATEFDDGKVESSVINCVQENEAKTKTETSTVLVAAGHDNKTLEGLTDVNETNETAIQETKVEDTNLVETSGILENLCHNMINSDIVDNDKFMEESKDEDSVTELPKEKAESYVRNISDKEGTGVKSETITDAVSAGVMSETSETAIQETKVEDGILEETSGTREGCNDLIKSDIVDYDQFMEVSQDGEGAIELNKEKVESCAMNREEEAEAKFDTSDGMTDITSAVLTENDNKTHEGLTDIKSETSENAVQKTEVEVHNLDETSGTLEGSCNDLIVGNDQFREVSEDTGATELNKEKEFPSPGMNLIDKEEIKEKSETDNSMADITDTISTGNDSETQGSIADKKCETSEIAVQENEVKVSNLDEMSGVLEDSHSTLLKGDDAKEDFSNETSEIGIVSEERNKIDVLSETKESVESLELAVTAGNYDEVCKILSSGTSGSLNALIEAVKGSYVEIFDCLFQAEIIKTVAESRKVLSVSKNASVASAILEVWPNAVKGEETAALLLSVANNEEVLDVLLNAGGKMFLQEALRKILRNGDVETFSKLVSKMTNVNCVVCCGQTLLHLAAEYNNVDCISVLLQNGADIECTDRNGYTATQRAAAFCSAQAVNILCNAGAIYDPLDKSIETITKSFYCCPNYKMICCK